MPTARQDNHLTPFDPQKRAHSFHTELLLQRTISNAPQNRTRRPQHAGLGLLEQRRHRPPPSVRRGRRRRLLLELLQRGRRAQRARPRPRQQAIAVHADLVVEGSGAVGARADRRAIRRWLWAALLGGRAERAREPARRVGAGEVGVVVVVGEGVGVGGVVLVREGVGVGDAVEGAVAELAGPRGQRVREAEDEGVVGQEELAQERRHGGEGVAEDARVVLAEGLERGGAEAVEEGAGHFEGGGEAGLDVGLEERVL